MSISTGRKNFPCQALPPPKRGENGSLRQSKERSANVEMHDGKLGCSGVGDLRVLLQNLRAAEGPLLQFVQQRAILRADTLSRGCVSSA